MLGTMDTEMNWTGSLPLKIFKYIRKNPVKNIVMIYYYKSSYQYEYVM